MVRRSGAPSPWLAIAAGGGVLLAGLLATNCTARAERDGSGQDQGPGPLVVVTLDGLRSDVVESLGGLPGLTPALDRLAGEADWSGSAISPSGFAPAAAAGVLTGLVPSARDGGAPPPPELAAELETLPEGLRGLGYETRAFVSSDWLRDAPGFLRGFDHVQPLGSGRSAVRQLRRAKAVPVLYWFEIAQPAPPYRLHPGLLSRLDALGARVTRESLPERLGLGELRRMSRSGRALTQDEIGAWWALYCLSVARADGRVGELLAALRQSGAWDRATIVVMGLRGMPLGDEPGAGADGTLRRKGIEVPLFVKLPADRKGGARGLEEGGVAATASLWASLVQLAGGSRPPAITASWLEAPVQGAWSERRAGNGEIEVSWVDGSRQVHLTLDTRGGCESGEVWEWDPIGGETKLEDGPRARALVADALARWRATAGGASVSPPPLHRVEGLPATGRHRDSG